MSSSSWHTASGARADEQMAIVARSLPDAEIAAVAAYHAAIRITVEPPDAPPPGKTP